MTDVTEVSVEQAVEQPASAKPAYSFKRPPADHTQLPSEDGPYVRYAPEHPLQPLPDHTQLPDRDGTFVKNLQEHPQSILLTESIWPTLQKLHPDGQFTIGQDSGLYWRIIEPPEKGAVAPDWFYVPNVPPMLDGQTRRSYVMWQEFVAPLIVIEFVSDTAGGEMDRTPYTGKFWVYEKAIRTAFYAVYTASKGLVEVYHLVEDSFHLVAPNQRRHFPIPQLGVELGIWFGEYKNLKLPWLRWWSADGVLLLTPEERAERLAAKLRELGINPDETGS